MSRIAYVNGAYLPMSDALVNIEDRGYQFSDGVYEGITVYKGALIDVEPHIDRLWRSLGELQIASPMERGPLKFIITEVVRRNRVKNGFVYLQITRGVARRDHPFPAMAIPALTITCKRLDIDAVEARARKGVAVSSQPDMRWDRCDVKSISLLPNILAKQAAREAGAFEAMMIDDDGLVTEGSSTNIWMVTKGGELVTRSTDDNILPGITRASVKGLCNDHQMSVTERAFTLEEALDAADLFLTSSTAGAMPIVELDGKTIADGKVGPVGLKLIDAYKAHMENQVS